MTVTRALFLSGKFGAGHDTLAEACAAALLPYGVESRIVDCMPMLGGGPSAVGNFVFRSLSVHYLRVRRLSLLATSGERIGGPDHGSGRGQSHVAQAHRSR